MGWASDPRTNDELAAAAHVFHRERIAVAWSDGLDGPAAKACSRSGAANWKKAAPLSSDEGAAHRFFISRARKHNPCSVASASGLDLVEADGDLALLIELHGLPPLPETLTAQSRRGQHLYLRTPKGCRPMKVQLDERGVIVSEDGYLVAPPSLHPDGETIYRWVDDTLSPAAWQNGTRELWLTAGAETREQTRRRFAEGEPIPEGHRDRALFWHAVELLRDSLAPERGLGRLLEINAARCVPPLDEKLVRKQFRGAVKWAHENPTETERARAEARRVMQEHRDGRQRERQLTSRRPAGGKSGRRLRRRALSSVAAKRVEWLIDKVVAVGTSTLVAGVGGLGKSALLLAWAKQVTLAGRDVLIVSYEDAAEQVLRPRFEAVGGDLERLHELYVDALAGSVSFPHRPPRA